MQKKLLTSLVLCLTLSASATLFAANISKQQAAQAALASHSGQVLSIKLSNVTYKVKVISSSGRVRVVLVNANNGNVIK